MSAYTPTSGYVMAEFIVLVGIILSLGFLLTFSRVPNLYRSFSWGLLASAVGVALFIIRNEPAGFRMLAVCAVVFVCMKIVVICSARETLKPAPFSHWLGFVLLWPGMRPSLFAKRCLVPALRNPLKHGILSLATGLMLFGSAWMAWQHCSDMTGFFRAAEILTVMVSLSLILHFGFFNLATAFWRYRGVNAPVLFRQPLRSSSLADFWSHRWNLGYSEMISQSVYRPISGLSQSAAIWSSYAFSGILHELAISVPVRAGYGLPTTYFLLQALLLKLEPRLRPVGALRRIYAILAVLLPAPLLFHPPFLQGVIIPLLDWRIAR